MGLHDPLRDAEDQSQAWNRIRGRDTMESLENPLLLLLRDSRPAVRNLQADALLGPFDAKLHGQIRRRILQRIIDELLDCELDESPVEEDVGRLGIGGNFKDS